MIDTSLKVFFEKQLGISQQMSFNYNKLSDVNIRNILYHNIEIKLQ